VSIGETLTSTREQAGMSLEQVAQATRIRRTLIEAIENDDFSPCGGDFYARGHLRNIAVALGTDPKPLLEAFDAEHVRSVAPKASEVFESETASRAERRGPNWSAAMAVALVLVLVYGVAQVLSGTQDTATEGVGGPSAPARSAGPASPSSSATSSAEPSAIARAPGDRVTVVLQARQRSWVQATTASGKELFQGLVSSGETKTFTDRQRIRLVVGNAGAVTLRVNGADVGAPGRRGQVARVQFTPQDPSSG
jgi:cytoskeleton protein RodZ